MFSPINLIIFILWFISAFIDYCDFAYVWQLKEYRLDRFKDFLSTQQGRDFWLRYQTLWRSVLAIILLFWPINDTLTIKTAIITIFLLDFAVGIYKLIKKKLRRPIITKKAMLAMALSILLEGTLFLIKRDWAIFFLLMILRFFIISFVIWILNKLTTHIKKYLIKKATEKLARQENLTVIGITGSYAKSTVKKFLTEILSNKFKIVCTPKNINTEIGIARFILANNFSDKRIFAVEMGAYKIGEVKLICDMVKPKIGIMTAINEQHLSLFGNIKNTQKTKYELLRSLPADGLAITNADNKYCTEFLSELKAPAMTFGLEEDVNPNILITNFKTSIKGTSFSYLYKGSEETVTSKILGDHNALNLGACILVADKLGMSDKEIKTSIENLTRVTELTKYGKCTIIDDSYNSNPAGFKAALNFLNAFPSEKRRIVVTRGMLELADRSEEIHEIIGGEISFVADELVIITPDFITPLKSGAVDKYKLDIKEIFKPEDLLEYLKSIKNTNSVVLLENRMLPNVMKEIGLQK
ncbi:MAG: UDP-N-acetylmuramoyl-tripeptide--D-alanyl-D-alanine ligase [Candidatus Magasanikbacteria bacterium]|jgi:UDP-N-acetylmuramoyl-tripeptide--D-alanyl-D-alanine ligase|nr:UDP-N-acetylmuramoyl-tripeptide--D-alanyl-D-alanine ligase [Candidatus Magasanikbacteria bacterium]MBT4314702.1 UDP-N-acetylmuramoyl-tripeptide--D-alanyl-D-alanine ligase [Candidatus Magasanikbacteria bacterium]MBT4547479.1 UDP-N-acetylmuramoyl-tripeptide--D-alanyl-D-alanine ligase [Candidatus Magasanikbacteria bacterium]MBT6819596.1 UDP-N-acetylmuramoyl-tripeptide--D-alanyl-D-alanine ligase [Candidatus Magasanikbacteria bacterium]